jgi:hypothetical protein
VIWLHWFTAPPTSYSVHAPSISPGVLSVACYKWLTVGYLEPHSPHDRPVNHPGSSIVPASGE